jgi:hypothetical protein
MCAGTNTGSVSLTTGSSSFTLISGTLAAGDRIVITDASSSPAYVGGFEFTFSGGNGTIAGIWPGATGTFNFMIEGPSLTGWMSSIWTGNTDTFANNTALSKFWACQYNSPVSLSLNRPWDGPTGSGYYLSSYTVGVFNQQPFMLGIKTDQINWAAHSADSASASGYAAIAPLVGAWMAAYGVDSNTMGTYYGRVTGLCEPFVTATPSPAFNSIHGWDPATGQPACGLSGLLQPSTERVNSVEAGAAMIQFYLANPTTANKAIVDQFYGAVFGYCPYTTGGVYCDANYVQFELSNSSMDFYKWPGFFFGMGGFFTASWPAVRNSAQPADIRGVFLGFDIGSAASASVVVTAPSGTITTFSCSAAPCAVTVDNRQGRHWVQISYLSGSGQVLATTVPSLLP